MSVNQEDLQSACHIKHTQTYTNTNIHVVLTVWADASASRLLRVLGESTPRVSVVLVGITCV